jgi:putative FmdB family regulatory protein
MPLYEYQCEANGHRFEVIQKFSDPLVDKCPTCGSPVHKLQSAPAIQFKGSGWYITDYARKDSGGGSKAGASSTDSSTSEGKKSESSAPAAGEKSDKSEKGTSASPPAKKD